MKVWVGIYEHKHGTDVNVFASEELVEAWSQAIADEYWEDFMGDDKKPESRSEMADRYWEVAGDAMPGEYFTSEPHEVQS